MEKPIDRIRENLEEARRYLNNTLDRVGDRWDAQVYAEGAAWSVRQLLIHLMITDKGHNNMLMSIAQGENSVPEDFDLERYNRRSVEKRAETTVEEARAALAQTEADRYAWLEGVDEETLARQGRHGSMRVLSIREILDVIAAHDRAHADDIARALQLS